MQICIRIRISWTHSLFVGEIVLKPHLNLGFLFPLITLIPPQTFKKQRLDHVNFRGFGGDQSMIPPYRN